MISLISKDSQGANLSQSGSSEQKKSKVRFEEDLIQGETGHKSKFFKHIAQEEDDEFQDKEVDLDYFDQEEYEEENPSSYSENDQIIEHIREINNNSIEDDKSS